MEPIVITVKARWLVGWLVGWLVFSVWWAFRLTERESRAPTKGSKEGPPCGETLLLATRFGLCAPGPTPGPHVRLNAG